MDRLLEEELIWHWLQKRGHFWKEDLFVTPDDVKVMAVKVLNHRIGLSYEAEVDELKAEDIIYKIIQYVEVP